jgi:N-hydroxyarylamine O-acetyltransferase
MTAFDMAAYLERIGRAAIPPTAAGLADLQRAQLSAIPFENFDAFTGRTPDLALPAVFEKTVLSGRGGYCFELNLMLGAAMDAVGFPVRRTLARVRNGASAGGPRTHLAILTQADGRRFLADAGFGGPGPLTPLALDEAGEQEAANGVYRIVEDPVSGERVVERRRDDGWFALYGFDEAHVGDMDILAANHVCATWAGAPFPHHLMLAGFRGAGRIGVFDRSLTLAGPEGEERRTFRDFEDFAEVVAERLGIAVEREMLGRVWERLGAAGAAGDGAR